MSKKRKNSRKTRNHKRTVNRRSGTDYIVAAGITSDGTFLLGDIGDTWTIWLDPVEFCSDGLPTRTPSVAQFRGLTSAEVDRHISQVLVERAKVVSDLSLQEMKVLLLASWAGGVDEATLTEVATSASQSDDRNRRVLAALSNHTPLSVLHTLAEDPDDMVRYASLTNANFESPFTDDDDEDEEEWRAFASASVNRILQRPECSESAMELALNAPVVGIVATAALSHWTRLSNKQKALLRQRDDVWSFIADLVGLAHWKLPMMETLALKYSESLYSTNPSTEEEVA